MMVVHETTHMHLSILNLYVRRVSDNPSELHIEPTTFSQVKPKSRLMLKEADCAQFDEMTFNQKPPISKNNKWLIGQFSIPCSMCYWGHG